ncbi:MAG: hypothetical protein QHH00_05825 [Methanomassiliicoccales archaeon]|jgi:hypothetical protein|nr:hypothetical protein [Methanomassiliicoccales archaeon]
MKEIEVEQEVIDFIKKHKRDYRVSTTCYGPVILPTDVKPPKDTDLRIKIGKNTLFVSIVQARYITKVTKSMLYEVDEVARKKCPIL